MYIYLLLLYILFGQVPKKADGDAACDEAVGGGAGVCVYLTRCSSAKTITTAVYSGTYCKVNDG